MKKSLLMMTMILSMFIVRSQGLVTALYESFESGIPSDWTVLDVDNDGGTWRNASEADWLNGLYEGSTGEGYTVSYDASATDNWLITPAISLGSDASLTFYRCVSLFYYAEHYGVYISTTTTDPSAFTLLVEETGEQSEYSWRQRTVNLSTYSGQTVYIAFRHFNSSSPNRYLALDDITVTMNTVNSTIVTSPSELNFGTVPAGSPTPSQQVSISAFNVANSVTASVGSPFEVSLDDSTFSNSVLLPNAGGNVYVRYFPTTANADNSALTLTGGNATQTVALSGVSLDCSTILLPYTQDFDSTTVNTIPDCWYQINPYQGFPKVSSYNAYSGMSLMFESDDDALDPIFAVMPLMPQTLSDLQLTFWTACDGTLSGLFSVGYVTDPSDGSTFVPIWSRTAGEMGDNNYHSVILDFSEVSIAPDHNYYIAFRYQVNTGWGWHVDNITVEVIPSCGAPTELTVEQVTDHSATLSWTGDAETYAIYYHPVGGTTWDSIQNVSLETEDFTVTGLLPSTQYEWYVSSDCGDGTYVNSLETSTFRTECAVYPTPYSEDFDAQTTIPDCWEKMVGLVSEAFAGNNPVPTNATSGWKISTTVFGSNHPKLNILGTDTRYWLVSPSIHLGTVTNPALVFDLALTDFNNANPIENPNNQVDDKFMVLVSTDDGATWSADNAVVWSDNPATGDYAYSQIATTGQEIIISLAEYANQTVRIAFYGESTINGGDNDLHIDNVMVIPQPSCARPMGLTVENITYNSADVSWNNDSVDAWLLEYKGENDTAWYLLDVTDNIVHLTGLEDYTHYTVRVRTYCGDDEYSLAAVASFTTAMAAHALPYSTDFGENSDRNWIFDNGTCNNYWTIGSLGDEGAMFITNNGTTAGYNTSSFSIVSAEKSLAVGTAEEVVISFDVRVGGEENFDYLKVFFAPAEASYPAATTFVNYAEYDYSVNAVRFPTILSVFPYILNRTNGNTVHVEVAMPNPNTNPTDSSIAKLVFLWKNDQSSGTPPGAIITNVSVYHVACPRPTNLTITNVTTHSADISWTPAGEGSEWILEYKATSDTGWTSVPLTTYVHTLTNLALGTDYQVRVQTDCGEDQSLWLDGFFTTFCDAVTVFPYTEGFENNGEMADCWMQEYVIDEMNWTINTGNFGTVNTAHSGSYNAFFYSSDGYFTTKLVSPIFDLTGVENPYMSYWYTHAALANNLDVLKIYYRTSPSAVWHLLSVHDLSAPAWTLDSLLLPNPSATYQIAFEGRANAGYGITVDDITIASAGPSPIVDTCETPTGLAVTVAHVDNDAGSYSIMLYWNSNQNVERWNVQYQKADEDWTTVSVNEQSCLLENFIFDALYKIRVQAVCGEDNTSDWSEPVSYAMTGPGIDDYLQNSINLYPNPANDVLNVQCTMNNVQWEGATIEVLDIYGKLLQTLKASSEITPINVSDLADGMYFVRVTTAAGVLTKRFVKE